MKEKIVKIILTFLSDGPKPRWQVTNKIKNYPKHFRDEAIKHVNDNELVYLTEKQTGETGRNPVHIGLTGKGKTEAASLSESPKDKSVWAV